MSLSNAPDTEHFGGSPEHLATFADDLVLYLLIAGLRVAYGGVLGHAALRNGAVEGDDINYVERLLAMVRSHSVLLSDVTGKPPVPIENWVAWPLHSASATMNSATTVRKPAREICRLPRPRRHRRRTGAAANGFVPPDTPAQRYARARSLTFMRVSMREGTSARIAMGGRLAVYQGLWPGVLEEGVIALRAANPSTCSGCLAAPPGFLSMRCMDPAEGIDQPWASSVPGSDELRDEYRRRGHRSRRRRSWPPS